MRAAIPLVVVTVAVALAGCANSPASEGLTAPEQATADWLSRAYSSGGASDVFFEGFWMSDAAFYKDTESWRCIFEGVVLGLGVPETQSALDELVSLSAVEPAFPSSHRDEIEAVLASLPESERTRLGHEVIASAERCADVRLGVFGGGGPVPVCIYDNTSDDQKAQIVASTMGAIYPDQYEWSEPVREIAQRCYDEVSGAYEAGETLDWVEDLERSWDQAFQSATVTTTAAAATPAEPETPNAPAGSRATPSPEWIGLEYAEEMDYELAEVFRVDVRTAPPTRIDLHGGWTAWGFYDEDFTIVENYFKSGLDPETPGERLLFMIQHTPDDTWIVLDAIQLTLEPSERLLECNSPEPTSILALVRGEQTDSGTEFHLIDAWQLSVEGGFEPTSLASVACP